jgi:LCP family protein required for cell wall assembly
MPASEQQHTRAAARRAGAPERGIARHGRLRAHPWATVGKIVASVVAVAMVSVLGIAGVAAVNLVSEKKASVHLVGETPGAVPDIGAIKGGVNILIAATDTRSGQGDAYGTTDDSAGVGLNDVTMLLHLSQDHSHAEVVSFPRDLVVDFPQCPSVDTQGDSSEGPGQLNTSLQYGGLACTVLVVEQLTGLKIPFAGLISFDGVVSMSNAIGGVPVCIGGSGIHDPDTELDLNPGTVTLQGQEAAQFLRTRHGVGDGSDLARISNQQVFLSSLVRTIMSNDTLTNPAKLWGIAKVATTSIQLSDSLNSATTLYQIAVALKGLDWSDITFVQYPVVADPDDDNRVVPDPDSASALVAALAADQRLTLTGGTNDGSVTSTDTPARQPSPSPSASSSAGSAGSSEPAAPPVMLSDNVKGQTAATQTCSNGAG